MSLAEVVTAQKLCDQYNAGLEEAREEAQKHNAAAIQDLVEVKAPLSTINRCLLQLPEPALPSAHAGAPVSFKCSIGKRDLWIRKEISWSGRIPDYKPAGRDCENR